MNEQIQYITELATQYKIFADDSDRLFEALNNLPAETMKMPNQK